MPIPFWAGHYIGLPFREHGRDSAGLDCWGLVRLVLAEQFGLAVPSYAHAYTASTREDELGPLIRRESRKWRRVPAGQESCGDIVVLRMRGEPMHVGIVLGDRSMLHIDRRIDSAIEPYSSLRWKDRVIGFFRHTGMTKTTRNTTDGAIEHDKK